jgi:hypothetical protein
VSTPDQRLTKDQVTGVNRQVDSATAALDAFIERNAGFFAGTVEADVNSPDGKKFVLSMVEAVYLAGWADCAAVRVAASAAIVAAAGSKEKT